ncbi:LAMI_0E12728g1_1 [Lachancea mirantina]|uniref:LAMI_0E12728g1_1 n=1 Tax=Lachancea mirantina TaxID=1230905 RepID=A0A1G4JQC0_9SACH|nr:LAMI_0E12728g1_1 [Lachancea mirantina]
MAEDDISEVRKRVRDRWSQFGNEEPKRVKSSRQLNQEEIIDLTSEAEETDIENATEQLSAGATDNETKESEGSPYPKARGSFKREEALDTPSFKIVKSNLYETTGASQEKFTDFTEIFSSADLCRCWLFSFQYELDYILTMFDPRVKLTIVAQKGTILPLSVMTPKLKSLISNMKTLLIDMPPFTCHHSKLIINEYKDGGVRIYIPSNNFTSAETNLPQQVVWSSPLLPRESQARKSMSHFRDSLLQYLSTYDCDLSDLNETITKTNFTKIEEYGLKFIYSSPRPAKKLFDDSGTGFRLLCNELQDFRHVKDPSNKDNQLHHYFCQVSTIGAPLTAGSSPPGNLLTHLMIPFLSGLLPAVELQTKKRTNQLLDWDRLAELYKLQGIKPYILYPTEKEIRNCTLGYMASGWFHYHRARNECARKVYEKLKSSGFFFKQRQERHTSRNTTPSHTKFYAKFTTNSQNSESFNCPDWVLFTTANLSLHAWGTATRKPKNYEVGVLMTSSENRQLVIKNPIHSLKGNGLDETASTKKTLSILLPYILPPEKFDDQDDCFCISKSYSQPDALGNRHVPSQ